MKKLNDGWEICSFNDPPQDGYEYEEIEIEDYDYGKDVCYDSVKRLTDRGMTQVNIHYMIAEETYDTALEVLDEIKTDPRLEKLNAIVFLSLKKKGRAVINNFHCLSQEKFDALVKKARDLEIGIGFDTCSSKKALNTLSDYKDSIEPCEATLSSSYIDLHGNYYPCSFQENVGDWKEGISVLDCKNSQDFIDKVWNNEKTEKFRQCLINEVCNGCKGCPVYEI